MPKIFAACHVKFKRERKYVAMTSTSGESLYGFYAGDGVRTLPLLSIQLGRMCQRGSEMREQGQHIRNIRAPKRYVHVPLRTSTSHGRAETSIYYSHHI